MGMQDWEGVNVKTVYTAEARVTGGRLVGHGRTTDGQVDIRLRMPAELGGPGDELLCASPFSVPTGYAPVPTLGWSAPAPGVSWTPHW